MTIDTKTYYKHLSRIQNAPQNAFIDIMTITAFMDTKEKIKHLERYAKEDNDIKAIELIESIKS